MFPRSTEDKQQPTYQTKTLRRWFTLCSHSARMRKCGRNGIIETSWASPSEDGDTQRSKAVNSLYFTKPSVPDRSMVRLPLPSSPAAMPPTPCAFEASSCCPPVTKYVAVKVCGVPDSLIAVPPGTDVPVPVGLAAGSPPAASP